MELSELNSRLKHATLLRSQNSPPLQSFTLGPDGIFRCVLPIPISIPVVTLVRPQTSPVTHAVFLAPRSGREVDNVSSRLEDKLQKVRFAGAEHLKDQLAIYKRAQRDKKILFVKSSGHHYVNENVTGIDDYNNKKAVAGEMRKTEAEVKHAIAVQKRNARQYSIINDKISKTREAMNMRKLRMNAMGEFIMWSSLNKSNTVSKSWLAMLVLARSGGLMMEKLAKHREEAARNSQLKAVTAITFFLINKCRQKRRRRSADLLIGFLKFVKNDGQIKSITKKLMWTIRRLQGLMHERVLCNQAQVVMIGKKYEKVIANYLIEDAKTRAELEVKAKKAKLQGKMAKKVVVPEAKLPLQAKFKQKQIKEWVIKNRQMYVTKLMAFETYELWPVAIDLIREKSLFGNPFEARKYVTKLKKQGKLYDWIVENGGADHLEGGAPVYRRIPSDEQIINDIYEPAIERSNRATRQENDMAELMNMLQAEMGLGDDHEVNEKADKEKADKEKADKDKKSPPKRRGSRMVRNPSQSSVGRRRSTSVGGSSISSVKSVSAVKSPRKVEEGSDDKTAEKAAGLAAALLDDDAGSVASSSVRSKRSTSTRKLRKSAKPSKKAAKAPTVISFGGEGDDVEGLGE